ncbi:DUF421 domain-containing protein [Robertmurraya korlensis]|uniref:DUF421 domain-containing protein n=1 Tax=Robertmurraya korlensis TaxID=519977 RepID=UPI000826D653|nr:DUF421 domain-containing protein [Robertmurraya korlensis]
MEYSWVWKAVLIVLVGTFLLRVAGRKSISQMTLAQTVIMIGLGSLLVQPVTGNGLFETFGVGGVLVATLFVMELLQVKSDKFEKFITGKAKILIEKGQLNEKNIKKVRMTVDQLEMSLRQANVSKLTDVEWATLEPNGQIGFILKPSAQPVTTKQFESLQQDVQTIKTFLEALVLSDTSAPKRPKQEASQTENELFKEVKNKDHDYNVPKHLQ